MALTQLLPYAPAAFLAGALAAALAPDLRARYATLAAAFGVAVVVGVAAMFGVVR